MALTTLTVALLFTTPAPPSVSEDVAAVIQAEKLRMNVLELKELVRMDQRFRAATLLFTGGYLMASSAIRYVGATELEERYASAGTFTLGLVPFVFGIVAALKEPGETELWETVGGHRERGLAPAIFIAEAEAAYAAVVEDATASRKRWGYGFMGGGLALGALFASQGVLQRDSFLNIAVNELVPLALLGYGIFYRFFYRLPVERAWDAYINDKNLVRSYARVRPQLSASGQGVVAAVSGTF